MNGELLNILDSIERDKGIKKEILIEAVESALISAARKKLGKHVMGITAQFDPNTGDFKVFGPEGDGNGFRIRTLHNRDPRGACAESLMPAGYMTTSFRTNAARKQMIVHQAKALGPLACEKACRTKLIGEVRGDVGKLFDQWNQFGWHRVTVYGDVLAPLTEFAQALGLQVIREA